MINHSTCDSYGFEIGALTETSALITKFFLIYKEIQMGSGAKSYITNGLLMHGEICAHFLTYLGSPSSNIILQPIPTEFPYT
jgi:hypothetical protein